MGGSQHPVYLPRLIGIGEPGSDVLISQDIKGSSDNVRFTFGNADRVMTQLANDTDLKYAEIDLCLFHVNSGILLQLWKGVIQNFTSDGTPIFPVTCSDGFFQIMNQYPGAAGQPPMLEDLQRWRELPVGDEGRSAAAVTAAGGDPTSCDYYLDSANGCQVHGMSPYFGGHQADPQGVVIKDDSTGFRGFGRSTVTATSIISDTDLGQRASGDLVQRRRQSGLRVLGQLPDGGRPRRVRFLRLARHRRRRPDRRVHRHAGLPERRRLSLHHRAHARWLNLAGLQGGRQPERHQGQSDHGTARVTGNDPAIRHDYFSLGQGTPQVWEPNNYAAGHGVRRDPLAQIELRIQPTTPDQHQMQVPIDHGLTGWTWDQNGNRTAVTGLTNPFWIAVNSLLRALGLWQSGRHSGPHRRTNSRPSCCRRWSWAMAAARPRSRRRR